MALRKNAIALAMNENNLLSFLALVFLQSLTEHIKLIVQNFTITHAGSRVEQLMGVKVYLYDIALRNFRLRLRAGITSTAFFAKSASLISSAFKKVCRAGISSFTIS